MKTKLLPAFTAALFCLTLHSLAQTPPTPPMPGGGIIVGGGFGHGFADDAPDPGDGTNSDGSSTPGYSIPSYVVNSNLDYNLYSNFWMVIAPDDSSNQTVTVSLCNTLPGLSYVIGTNSDAGSTNWTAWCTFTATNLLTVAPSFDVTTNPIFFRAQMVWESSNGLPGWWMEKYFGTLAESTNTDYDGLGLTIAQCYQFNIDPNQISFLLAVTNQWLGSTSAPVQITVTGGVPSYMATLVDPTNFNSAVWTSFNSNLVAAVTNGPGWHYLYVGVKGLANDSVASWHYVRVHVATSPPYLTITNFTGFPAAVSQPITQLQGCAAVPLASIFYAVSNAGGVITNQQAFVTGQYYATNVWAFSTNYFQCYDVPLAVGTNILTLHAVDLAGNSMSTNLAIAFSLPTNPPTLGFIWPTNGVQISGSNFAIRATVSDPTVSISAQIVDTNGDTNVVTGLVERNGHVWVENLPLMAGTNILTLTATDAATNVTTTNITVMGSSLAVSMSESGDLWQPTATLSGSISDYSASLTVNGVSAVNSSGSWTATNVPVPSGGVAVFSLVATSGGNQIMQELDMDKPARLYVKSYNLYGYDTGDYTTDYVYDTNGNLTSWSQDTGPAQTTIEWADGVGGSLTNYYQYTDLSSYWPYTNILTCASQITYNPGWWPDLPDGYQTHSGNYCADDGTNASGNPVFWSYQDLDNEWLDFTDLYDLGGPDEIVHSYQMDPIHEQAQISFETGGKAIIGGQSFYLFTASASEGTDDGSVAIPPQQIAIGSLGHLDTNGNLWVVLPDGDPDATPVAAGYNNYTFTNNATGYTLNHQCVAATNILNPSRLTLGVGEQVNLYFTPTLTTNAIWTISAGGVSAGYAPSTTFTAPSNAANNVTLTVSLTNGPSLPSLNFQVLEPTGVSRALWRSNDMLGSNVSGCSTWLTPYFDPSTVSFYRVQALEVGSNATGIYGYFTNSDPTNLSHIGEGADVWFNLEQDNSWQHLNPNADIWDHAYFFTAFNPPSGSEGGFLWQIPYQWRVGTNGTASTNIPGWYQSFDLHSDGSFTIVKFNWAITRLTNDAYVELER